MKAVTTTRLSSKGQVVIPEAIRRRLRLDPGAEFVVLGDDNTHCAPTGPCSGHARFRRNRCART